MKKISEKNSDERTTTSINVKKTIWKEFKILAINKEINLGDQLDLALQNYINQEVE